MTRLNTPTTLVLPRQTQDAPPPSLPDDIDELVMKASARINVPFIRAASELNPYQPLVERFKKTVLRRDPFNRDYFLIVRWCAAWEARLEQIAHCYTDAIKANGEGVRELTAKRERWHEVMMGIKSVPVGMPQYAALQTEKDDLEAQGAKIKLRLTRGTTDLEAAVARFREAEMWLADEARKWLA